MKIYTPIWGFFHIKTKIPPFGGFTVVLTTLLLSKIFYMKTNKENNEKTDKIPDLKRYDFINVDTYRDLINTLIDMEKAQEELHKIRMNNETIF